MQNLARMRGWVLAFLPLFAMAGYSQHAAPAADDIKILDRASELLSDEKQWNRADTRECSARAQTISLFCALHAASIEVLGRYDHRRAALEEVRFAIEEVSDGRKFEHRLMDFNNHPSTTFAAIRRVLAVARGRIATRLPPSEPSKASPEPER